MQHSEAPGPLPDRRSLVICTGFIPSHRHWTARETERKLQADAGFLGIRAPLTVAVLTDMITQPKLVKS